jgi:hypothetical protein
MHRKLSFTLAGGPIYWRTDRLKELCKYLTANVVAPMFPRNGAKSNRRFMNFFTCDDAAERLAPTGTIRFAVPPQLAGQVGELETSINRELAKLRIKVGPFKYERDPALNTVQSILIPITENPTALAAPPDVNMSHFRGCVVLTELLGYQRVNGRYEFTADDLVQRASSVTENRITSYLTSPVKGSEKVRRTPRPVRMRRVHGCLEEVKQFGLWALNNNHRKLAAV